MNHHIVEGNEKNGYCDVCGLGGDLTIFSCENNQRMKKTIQDKIAKGDYKSND